MTRDPRNERQAHAALQHSWQCRQGRDCPQPAQQPWRILAFLLIVAGCILAGAWFSAHPIGAWK